MRREIKLIKSWKPFNSIHALKESIDDLKLTEGCIEDHFDVTNLPTTKIERFAKKVQYNASYPIWSCDDDGYCLVGEQMDQIEHIYEIAGE